MYQKNYITRLYCYFIGLFAMTIGVALSVKSNLGASSVSSIPYTMTCVWGIEMGKATIIFHFSLVMLQLILLRSRFPLRNLFQVLVGIVFGYFTTFCNYLMTFLPTPNNFGIRLLFLILSMFFIAFGIFLYVPANLIPLAGEGVVQVISDLTKVLFAKVKIMFDCSMVLVSLITCVLFLKTLGSVGIGTVVSAVLVGTLLSIISKFLGPWRKKIMGGFLSSRPEQELRTKDES